MALMQSTFHFLILSSLLIAVSCADLVRLEDEDLEPLNKVYRIEYNADGSVANSRSYDLPASAFTAASTPVHKDEPASFHTASSSAVSYLDEKIEPLLRSRAENLRSEELVDVIITFQEEVYMPSFKRITRGNAEEKKRHQQRAEAKVNLVKEFRESRFAAKQAILDDVEAVVREKFWIINSVSATMPARHIRRLAGYDSVVRVERGGSLEDLRPPQNANPNDDILAGRQWMRSDSFKSAGNTNLFIGLLDTGIYPLHDLFNAPSHIDFIRDCSSGPCMSIAGDNAQDCWNHGTSSAAILTANNNSGNAFLGTTAITVDSWRIYPACGGLSVDGAIRAFEQSTIWDQVLVAEIQVLQDQKGSLAAAANAAFDAGRVIIAANGNVPSVQTVAAPACAHKVIGVGSYDVQTGEAISSQARGPTLDGRTKPDVRAPTNVESASAAGPIAYQTFTGTSCATPFAAGAAALLMKWYTAMNGDNLPDPGSVYAALIAYTDNTGTPFDNTNGAGRILLGEASISGGAMIRGRVAPTYTGENIDIAFTPDYNGNGTVLTGALWWGETSDSNATYYHNDLDIHLYSPVGLPIAYSTSVTGVFEKVRIFNLMAGTYYFRINAYTIRTPGVSVYYAFANHRVSEFR